jgi:hypothetical protein
MQWLMEMPAKGRSVIKDGGKCHEAFDIRDGRNLCDGRIYRVD